DPGVRGEACAAAPGRGGGLSGRVWILGPDGNPKPVMVRLGITDGNLTELVDGDLSEGREVIVGGAERPGSRPTGTGGAGPRLRF
ncbi:MAG: hypothetical protein AAB285_07095, partial [candidate division NC10 bacterium]